MPTRYRPHGYTGSLRSVQRAWRDRYGVPRVRARRRVETPPGAQAQVDWAHFPEMHVEGELVDLFAFHMELSHSRRTAIVWSRSKDQLSWLGCHNDAFTRLGGIPASCRVDNEKTAVVRGAGPWGRINATYQRYAKQVRFHIDPCLPRSPEHKGKVERRIRSQRRSEDPRRREWCSLGELQEWTDATTEQSERRRVCPATGTSVWEAWRAERPRLTPLDHLPVPFDVEVRRQVAIDCLVSFERRQYSVPFPLVGSDVLVRGCHGRVQALHDYKVVADHPRHTAALVVIDPAHFDGASTDRVIAPTPLGRVGRTLEQLAASPAHVRAIDYYDALVEATR